ncbi:MAG: hypothetical protein ACREQ9_05405, partial [Candidatus Binatia bacterium]
MGRRAFPLVLLTALAACAPVSPAPTPPETIRFQRRLVRASFEQVWEAAIGVLEERDLGPAESDRDGGTIASASFRRRVRTGQEELLKELVRIADVEPARRLGLQALSEYQVVYRIDVEPRTELSS